MARPAGFQFLFYAQEVNLDPVARQRTHRGVVRLSEAILALYFAYVTALSFILSTPPAVRIRTLVVNGAVLCIYSTLLRPARIRESLTAKHLRNWIPLALML